MIWLFRVNQVFWDEKEKVNECYRFDTTDINFDIDRYDITLYFPLADYYLLDEFNDNKLYTLRLESVNKNPTRILISEKSEIYKIIKDFYKIESRDNKINDVLND